MDRLSSLVWRWLTRHAEKESEVEQMRAKLWQPPPDYRGPIDSRSPWAKDAETSAFQALRGQVGLTPAPKAE